MANIPSNSDRPQGAPRQRSGRACNNCRRRKMGCDRRAPCSSCKEQGIECSFDAPAAPRGPKRGYIEALRSRIVSLEQRLEDAGHGQGTQPYQQPSPSSDGRSSVDMSAFDLSGLEMPSSAYEDASSSSNGFPMDFNMDLDNLTDMKNAPMFMPESFPTPYMMPQSDEEAIRTMSMFEMPNEQPMPALSTSSRSGSISSPPMPSTPGRRQVNLSESQCAELDQVFLVLTGLDSDRVHASAPMLHRTRYTAWSRASRKNIDQHCLQYAMWAVAATAAPGWESLRDLLYREAWRLLGEQDIGDNKPNSGGVHIETVQAWILLAHGELMQRHERQAWVAAGRCLRLVHLMRLFELDRTTSSPPTPPKDWVGLEEKRRTFWMAFILDRLVSTREALPLTLGKQKLSTRQPIPEADFQNA
ncbi:hypothetical protein M409DRAFT_49172 [Zasmidium cellare ATCC 36951]|uniref:Zn(2)-C6 fungal-type domain-containing protein n=1 Tax=Zasmidium cellare ATCC 36951 TaxID=1080233 RepID=A0A6A6CZG0_ZASCE|nr:uncharacterized protein M409DRAFT_49172 [Zasmidium cellare ATCC 36951]KAF2172617.1 hypothetical protein M409DRAFT_49172 [Zasmidium cellare ATCC 36951]